ncbi:hypothetical protein B9Z55_023250 [Caenorhabditis nigoni]|uniref:BPTI/Kunitz inhibitor domain-containing protein n=1 Tax=Caenorhabditis nigoni TaxID=1611254 RepID=A0A2G5SPG8_9PELO|nr:hypothetical protein B9Z55_023250 [Caenorhabditis nigoni]
MRLLLLIAALVPFVLSQYYIQPQMRPVMQPQQQRTMYYPVRTNCQNRCNQQTRYRWNVRPTNIRPNVQVQIRTIPSQPGPIRPIVNPGPVPTLPTPPPSTLPPITYPRPTAGIPITIPETTVETTTQPSTTTTLETPAPESTPSMAPSHTDPTPAPETTVAPTTKYLRPERKQTKAKYFNPCAVGQPLLNEFSTPISCNYLNQPNGGCPEDHFCHTGASFSTTACCPLISSEDRCAQRRDTGEGDELVARWYFDSQAKECRRFLYKGIRGNANNFVTKAQCVDACEAGLVILIISIPEGT